MKKTLRLLLCLTGFALAGLEPYPVASPGNFKHFNTYGNAAAKRVRMEGHDSIRVTLGGLGTTTGGAVQFMAPAFAKPADDGYDSVTITYKGDGGTGNFVVLLSDGQKNSWCWNGVRWQPSAMLPCYNEDWVKKVLSVRDFRYCGARKTDIPALNLKNVTNLQLAIGMQLKDPSEKRAEFYLYEIAFERGAKEKTVFRSATKSPAVSAAKPETAAVPSVTRKPNLRPLSAYRLPEWIDWKRENHFQRNTAMRHSISLNNYWQFQPVPDSAVATVLKRNGKLPPFPVSVPETGEWNYVKVPGRWDGNAFYMLDRKRKRVSEVGGLSPAEYAQGWLRRSIFIPREWNGSRFSLQFNAVGEQARLFINGVPVQDFSKTGSTDITGSIRAGEQNEIALFIQYSSLPLKKTHGKFREFCQPGMGAVWWYRWHDGPGITDDVWLHVLPAELPGRDLRILTSVEKKTISADAEFTDRSGRDRTLLVGAAVNDGEKTVLTLPERKVVLKAGTTERIAISGIWNDPVCWSPENPKLYTLRLYIRDESGRMLDELSDEFGFRELTFRGGDFYLNGSKIRLMFKSSQFRYASLSEQGLVNMLTALKKMNFNGLILETLNERTVKLCNRLGMMVVLRHVMPPLVRTGTYLPGVPNHGYPFEVYLAPKFAEAKRELERTVTGIVQKFRNDPSLVIWAINPLLCWNSEWINPNRIDAVQPQNDILKASLLEEAFLHRLDPSRLVLQSMGGSAGAIIASNPYPTFENLPDEWADWPMKWSAAKKKPLVLEEIALPFIHNYANWRNDKTGQHNGWNAHRQLFYEQAARYFGDSIYEQSSPEQPDSGWNSGKAGTIRENGVTRNRMDHAMERTAELWLTRCLKAWRAYDISGIWLFEATRDYFSSAVAEQKELPASADLTAPGAKPDYSSEYSYDYPNRLHAATSAGQRPFLAFLAGRPERFSSREHAYHSGDTVLKQMIFSNDFLKPVKAEASWRIVRLRDGRQASSGSWSGTLAAGEVRKVPFRWTAPPVTDRETYRILFTARTGKELCNDSFDLHIFPKKETSPVKRHVLLYDENGKTRSLLKQMGIAYIENPTERELSGGLPLIVGRESFSPAFLAKCREWKLERFLNNGLTMLVLAQNGNGALKEYLEERRSRRVFPKDKTHPVLNGFPAADLQYWRGESDMLEPYPDLGMAAKNSRFMRWGAEGTVASFVMDKPFSGRFRVLLDCDADLSRTPLLEYFTGKGRILFCQLDFQPRYGTDPAATRLADRLFSYVQNPEPAPETVPAVLSGSAQPLKGLGFDFLRETELEKAKLLVLTSGFKIPAERIRRFAENGGRVMTIGLSARELSLLKLPEPVRRNVRLAEYPKDDALLRGLGNSDFYFNPAAKLPAFEKSRIVKRIPAEKGEFVVVTAVPADFKENASETKFRRILSCLLTNLGAPSSVSPNFSAGNGDIALDGRRVPFHIDPESRGETKRWHLPETDDSGWRKLEIGSHWEGQGITMKNPHYSTAAGLPYDGDAWYRIPVVIPEEWKGKPLFFDADTIDDLDWVWFNGTLIGHTGEDTPQYWSARRLYRIPAETVRYGKTNRIAVRVRDLRGNGGIIGKLRIGGAERESGSVFFERPSRLIQNFDPNSWRQW